MPFGNYTLCDHHCFSPQHRSLNLTMTPKPADITVEDLLDIQQPTDIRISPSGEHVVYQLKPFCKKGEHWVSSLWLAEVGKEDSARQLTSGLFEDKSPRWSSDGKSIAFISDRAKAGESSAIYILAIAACGGEAYPVTDAEKKKAISEVSWSPDGNFIAYLSTDEKTPEREKKDKEKDDVQVFGEEWELNRLRLVHVATRALTSLGDISSHVSQIAWKEDSKEMFYIATQTPELESAYRYGAVFSRTSIDDRKITRITEFKGGASEPHWSGEDIYFLANVRSNSLISSSSLWKLSLKYERASRHAFGEESCALGLRKSNSGKIYVQVQHGLADEVHILDGPCVYNYPGVISTWDVAETEKRWQLALGVSTPSSPIEIHALTLTKSTCSPERLQITSHSSKIASQNIGTAKMIHIKTADGKAPLDFVYYTPGPESQTTTPLPTVVLVHGGPYYRATVAFDCYFNHWQALLLATGKYGVLTPNYRGSSGYGDAYAATMLDGAGTVDYDDVITSVDEGIKRGLVDPKRIVVAGWSQGGFMSYMCAARNGSHTGGWRFKGAIPGAGVTDQNMMAMTSDVWKFQSELAGGCPWEVAKDNVSARKGSAIWELGGGGWRDVPPCLLLHGEKDERVPVTQAWAWKRACLQYGIPCEMCVYPREPHGVKERAHLLDMLKRVRRFVDMCIG